MQKSRLKTISYIFMHTVLLQLIVIIVFLSVCSIAYAGVTKYSSALLIILGAVAFIVMLFSFMCVSIFAKSYGLSLFATSRRSFDASAYNSAPLKRYDVTLGRKDSFTGRRSIFVRERNVQSGGVLLVIGLPAIWFGLFGIFKFIIESCRVAISDERRDAWEECRDYLHEKINAEGKESFFKTPKNCAILLGIIMAISIPITAITAYRYQPSNVVFSITDKSDIAGSYGRKEIVISGTVKNIGDVKIKQIEGILTFIGEDGNILYKGKCVINAPFSTTQINGFLNKGEKWNITWNLQIASNDKNTSALWGLDLDDIAIILDVSEITYGRDKTINFSNETIIVKPFDLQN